MTLLHRWLLNSGVVAWALLVASVIAAGVMAADRTPPFRLINYAATPAPRGGLAFIDAQVHRDVRRSCAVKLSRFLIDAAGTRWDMVPLSAIAADGLRAFEAASPSRLRFPVEIPRAAAVGPATLLTSLAYRCNVTHDIVPIDVVLSFWLDVLP